MEAQRAGRGCWEVGMDTPALPWSSHSSWLCSLEPVHGINCWACAGQVTESLEFSFTQKFCNQTHHQPDGGSGQILEGVIIDQLRLRITAHAFQNHLSLFLHSMFTHPTRSGDHRSGSVIPAEVQKYTVILRTTTLTYLWWFLGPKKCTLSTLIKH